MTEQVIDIRDRIEKMRTQMTGSSNSVPKKKEEFVHNDNKNLSLKPKSDNQTFSQKKLKENQNLVSKKADQIDKSDFQQKSNLEPNAKKEKVAEEVFEDAKLHKSSAFEKKNVIQSKIYKDYQNDNIYDEKKNSVKFEEDQQFPQFNLNVSNPISWKLMLLIMLMQLLTNIMLVVVLYLK